MVGINGNINLGEIKNTSIGKFIDRTKNPNSKNQDTVVSTNETLETTGSNNNTAFFLI